MATAEVPRRDDIPSPKIEIIKEPVCALLLRMAELIVGWFMDTKTVPVPTRIPDDTCIRKLPPTPRAVWQSKLVAETHKENSHAVTAFADGLNDRSPSNNPANVTAILPDPPAFDDRTELVSMESTENDLEALRTSTPELTTTDRLAPAAEDDLQNVEVSESQLENSDEVKPNLPAGETWNPPMFELVKVTMLLPVDAMFDI
mmetsp:Transcript_5958/g.19245  ORF Transcript_5958/g.19245 Transcript_5958/m.19245 type:complete len:202 (+) Transcript_5958:2964-3569(+)